MGDQELQKKIAHGAHWDGLDGAKQQDLRDDVSTRWQDTIEPTNTRGSVHRPHQQGWRIKAYLLPFSRRAGCQALHLGLAGERVAENGSARSEVNTYLRNRSGSRSTWR